MASSLTLFIDSGAWQWLQTDHSDLSPKFAEFATAGFSPSCERKKLQAVVSGTQLSAGCPTALWHALKADEIAKDVCLILGR